MGRTLLLGGVLGILIAGVVVLVVGLPQGTIGGTSDPTEAGPRANTLAPREAKAAPPRAQPGSSSAPSVEVVTLPGVGGPLVVPGCRLVAIYRQEVPRLKDGQLLFIATQPGPSEEIPDDRLVEVDVRFQVVPVKAGDKVPDAEVITLPGGSRRYRLVKEGESVDAVDLLIIQQHKRLRRLTVGDKVKEGQILA